MALPTTIEPINHYNKPSEVYLSTIPNKWVRLPIDVVIGLDGDKVIAESKILDGVAVFERISRKPFEINFEFTCREQDESGNYVFPQDTIQELVQTVWQKDQVIQLKNTFLNSLGISNIILQSITFTSIRGNTTVICSIKAKESPDSNNSFATT